MSSVQHQSALELSEAGVEAAAATSTAMSRMSLSSFVVNRPFLFFILEDSTSLPLFVGSVRNPNRRAAGAQGAAGLPQRDSFQDHKAAPRRQAFRPRLETWAPSEEDYLSLTAPSEGLWPPASESLLGPTSQLV